MTNSDKHSNLILRMRNCKNLVNKALNTKKGHNSDIKSDMDMICLCQNWWSFNESFAGCLGNIMKL